MTTLTKPLSARQQRMLDYIGSYIREHEYSPAISDIMAACGISSESVVVYNLNILEERGLLTRAPATPRSIRLRSEKKRDACPFCGCDGGHIQ